MSSTAPDPGDGPTVNERLLRASRGALGLWFDAAKWWTGAIVEEAGAWLERGQRLQSQDADELAYGFPGLDVETELDGQLVQAKLQSVRLHRGGRAGGQLELSDVRWDGLRIAVLVIVAHAVAVSSAANEVSLTGVEARGTISLAELVAWADRRTPRWNLRVTESGLIAAAGVSDPRRVCFVPSIVDGELVMELREVGWRRVRVPIPRWLRLARTAPLPPLPPGTSVSDARRTGDRVEFVLAAPEVTRPLALGW